MIATLNIGLYVAETGKIINPIQAIAALNVAGLTVTDGYLAVAHHEHGEEQTLVVQIGSEITRRETLLDTLYIISGLLLQDCIAVQFPDGTGELVGPKAQEWGSFNDKYFLPLAGKSQAKEA